MRKSLIGMKIGTYKIIGHDGVKNKNSYYLCKCNCGLIISICRPSLVRKIGPVRCECFYSLENKKFGKLFVSKLAYKKNNTTYWHCDCDCGKKVIIKRAHLADGRIRSCGCIRKGKESSNWIGCGDISGSAFGKIKNIAKRRNIEFDITIDYVWDLFVKQKGKCALSGVDICFSNSDLITKTASLDRIDSTKGYVFKNVQWVHKEVNFMKQQLDQDVFIDFCNKITKHQQLKNFLS